MTRAESARLRAAVERARRAPRPPAALAGGEGARLHPPDVPGGSQGAGGSGGMVAAFLGALALAGFAWSRVR